MASYLRPLLAHESLRSARKARDDAHKMSTKAAEATEGAAAARGEGSVGPAGCLRRLATTVIDFTFCA